MSAARLGDLDRALAHPVDLDRAWSTAHGLPYVPLDRRLRLAIRLGEAADPRYEPTARRVLVGVLEDVGPTLIVAKTFADALAHAHTGIYVEEAQRALWRNVPELRRIELRDAGFDSWARRNPGFA
ncbi:MAG TPA: hypothetical protein VMH33_04755 [Solirubrobacterales bacterium]|nr:hypothetical protein [Solirubrobacterales bacterium]